MSLAQGTFLQNMAPVFLVLMGRVKLAWHCGKMNSLHFFPGRFGQ